MNVQKVYVKGLRPYEENAKKHSEEQIKKVSLSIQRFGWSQPLVVDKNYNVIIGHCRLEAAKLLGLTEVPVLVMESLTEDEVKALRLADNKLNESAWDMDLVIPELQSLAPELVELTGFTLDDLSNVSMEGFFEESDAKEKEPKKCPSCGYQL